MNNFSYETMKEFELRKAENAGEFRIDLREYFRTLRRYRWSIILGTALITALASLYVTSLTPVYRATSTLLIEAQQANLVSIEQLYNLEQEDQDYYLTQYELLKSRKLAERVVGSLGLHMRQPGHDTQAQTVAGFIETIKALFYDTSDQVAEATEAASDSDSIDRQPISQNVKNFDPSILSREERSAFNQAVGKYLRSVSIVPVRNTKLVKVSYESSDPMLAAEVANAIGEQYIQSFLDAKVNLSVQASTWLAKKLSEQQIILDASEQRLVKFKEDNNLIDVNGSVGRLNETTLMLTTTELAEALSRLSDVEELFNEVQNIQNNAPEFLQSVSVVQDDPLVRTVKVEQGQAQRQLDELLNRYGERHPRVIDAKSRLDSLNALMDGHVSRVVSSIENRYKLAGQRVAAIRRTLEEGRSDIQLIGQKRFELDALEREVATNRDLYEKFFRRVSETRSAGEIATANARFSDNAMIPHAPVWPKKQLVIALAAFVSLMLLSLLAIVYESLDKSIKRTSDVERKLGIRMLGAIPMIKRGFFSKKKPEPLSPLNLIGTERAFVESIRTVRTSLFSANNFQGKNQVLMITSSVPGEGKSTTSLNLAYMMSKAERVLLIEADMRRPSLANTLGCNANEAGLSHYLSGHVQKPKWVKKSLIGNLDVMLSGDIPDDPLELLSSSRFENMIAELRKHYDRIVIDSAPVQAVSDSLVIANCVDQIAYVIKSNSTPYSMVQRGLHRFAEIDFEVAGAIVSQVDVSKLERSGDFEGYQGYYDYYGYSGASSAPNGVRKSVRRKTTPDF